MSEKQRERKREGDIESERKRETHTPRRRTDQPKTDRQMSAFLTLVSVVRLQSKAILNF